MATSTQGSSNKVDPSAISIRPTEGKNKWPATMNADLPEAASAASSARAEILPLSGLSNNPVIGLDSAPDLILRLPVAGRN